MAENNPLPKPPPRPLRWWPGALLLVMGITVTAWVRVQSDWPFQKRNLTTAQVFIALTVLLVVWWTFFSRASNRLRRSVTYGLVGLAILGAALFRLRGMSGDMMPIIEFRWARRELPTVVPTHPVASHQPFDVSTNARFPQFYGPNRDGVLPGPRLETNWSAQPPEVLWRQKIGAAWSGFAIVGNVAITQEQRGADECVVAYELTSGQPLWLHADPTRYHTTIAGEGPRATPTVVSNRVFTSGATGILNCLDLATGKLIWSRNVVAESKGEIPQWGAASSPLFVDGLVIVHGGESATRSLFAFHVADGKPAWSAGAGSPSYASPALATLAGRRQVLAFNDGSISGHDPVDGVTFWEKHWGNGNVACSAPVVISENRVLFSSGYGVGAELLEISTTAPGKLSSKLIWKSVRMKAKFAHMFARAGFLYGLDDGMFACVDLKDGSQRWKEGRHGHGQGLLVGDLYLLLAESGDLVLLQPTPDAPNELARWRVFNSKTWNPPALSGDLLLVRNDQEVACLRLKGTP